MRASCENVAKLTACEGHGWDEAEEALGLIRRFHIVAQTPSTICKVEALTWANKGIGRNEAIPGSDAGNRPTL